MAKSGNTDINLAISALEDFITYWQEIVQEDEDPISRSLKLTIDKLIEKAQIEIAHLRSLHYEDDAIQTVYEQEMSDNKNRTEPDDSDEFIEKNW